MNWIVAIHEASEIGWHEAMNNSILSSLKDKIKHTLENNAAFVP